MKKFQAGINQKRFNFNLSGNPKAGEYYLGTPWGIGYTNPSEILHQLVYHAGEVTKRPDWKSIVIKTKCCIGDGIELKCNPAQDCEACLERNGKILEKKMRGGA